MNLDTAVKTINSLIEKEQPKTFSSSWISAHSPSVYQFIHKNFRTENDHVDWDMFTCGLERKYLKRWTHYKRKPAKSYENQTEVDLILLKYQEKIYTFVAPIDDTDREIRSRIIISFVRIAQKGNILAEQELVKWMRYVVDDWVEKYYPLFKWKGYGEDIDEKIRGCIRGYKYTGSALVVQKHIGSNKCELVGSKELKDITVVLGKLRCFISNDTGLLQDLSVQ